MLKFALNVSRKIQVLIPELRKISLNDSRNRQLHCVRRFNAKLKDDQISSTESLTIFGEVDENQHMYNIPGCESGRIDELLDGRSIILTNTLLQIKTNKNPSKIKKESRQYSRF